VKYAIILTLALGFPFLSVCLSMARAASGSTMDIPPAPTSEWVVLVHGMGRSTWSLKRVEVTLRKAGYHVINVPYPAKRCPVEDLANVTLAEAIRTRVPANAATIHFVTHSLGGLVLREYLAHHHLDNLGRVVMLAPPNKGSEIADWFKKYAWGRWILGPAGRELGTSQTDLPQRLPAVNYETGVIAGDRSADPWFAGILPAPCDGKVTVQNTKVRGMTDFIVIHYSHMWMMWHKATLEEVLSFLRDGHFRHDFGPHVQTT
jgi:pimeloyl-ACP methyl ester carboxylesterase